VTAPAATAVTRIKICCIASIVEARAAIAAGADAVGLVSQMPSGPGVIADELIAEIAAAVRGAAATFLLTSLQDPRQIVVQQRRCATTTVQLVDELPAGAHAQLRQELPDVSLVQVIHVVDEASVRQAVSVAPHVDALLLDSGNPSLRVKELGGTGRTHDWDLSAQIVTMVGVPVFLAGGLNPGNVAEAIARVRPFGVDLCSGVRTDGRLDPAKLARFVTAVRTNPAAGEIRN
jgi:phosphoribosylanthranilate isomerase